MEVTDFLVELEGNPDDAVMFDRAVEEALAEGGVEGLESFLAQVMEFLGDPAVAETFVKKADAFFRRERTSDKGRIVAWAAAVVAWKILNDLVRAEFFMRGVGEDKLPDVDTWLEFYRVFYASRGNWLRLEQFMGEAVQKFGKPEIEMKRTLARTAAEANNSTKELSYWQEVAKLDPGDDEASSSLEKLYAQLQRWPSLAELYKARFTALPDDAVTEKVFALKQMLEIYDQKMRAEPKVLSTYQMILDVDPANIEAMDSLLAKYEAAGRWPDYAKVLDRKIESASDIRQKVGLMEKKAELMETRFANAMEAMKAYEAILEIDPERRDILNKLKDLYEKRHDYENLIRIRRAEADSMPDGAEKAAQYADLAVMATERLRKFPVAIELWELVLILDESNDDALRALEGLYERTKELDKLAVVLQRRQAMTSNPAESIAILEKLAQLFGTKLEDANGAMETWRKILDVDPNHERAKRELRTRYLGQRKWDELEWFLRRYGNPEELARTLEGQVNSIPDLEEKKGVLFKLAAIWRDELGQATRAVKNLEGVLAVAPNDARAAGDLIDLYRGLSDWRKLPKVYEVAIAGAADFYQRQSLRVEAAEVQKVQLNNTKEAFFLYLAAFQEDMLNGELQEQLELLAGPSDNWDVYVAALEQAVNVMTETSIRIRTWLRIGEIYSENLGDIEAGQAAFKRALDMDTGNREAITALEAIYRKLNRHEDLIRILQMRLSLVTDIEERKAVRFEIATALYDCMGAVDEAVATWNDILAADPLEFTAYSQLGELLLKEKRYEELRGLLNRQIDAMFTLDQIDPVMMADLYSRVGLLTSGIDGNGSAAVDAYETALNYVPGHAATIEMLEDLIGVEELRPRLIDLLKGPFEAAGRDADLADLIEMELQIKGDSIDTIDLLWKLEELYAGGASNEPKRFRVLSRIMMVTPDVTRAWDNLELVTASLGSWRSLVDLYSICVEMIEMPDARVSLNLRLARILWEELKSVDEARKAFHAVLALDDSNETALDALETIYEGLENHPELLKVYRRRFEVSPYSGEKIAYAFKMAAELSDHLEDIEGAIEAIRKVLEIDPEYSAAWRQLDNLYVRAERWLDLADVLGRRISLAEGDADRTWLRLRLAETLETKLEDLGGAVNVYQTILDGDPANADTLVQLERLFDNPDVKVLVAPILLPAYRASGDDLKLVAVYDVLAEAADYVDTRLMHYATIAEIYEINLKDLDRAFEYRSKAFSTAPERRELVDEVLRLGAARQKIDEAVHVLAGKVFDIGDEEPRRETHRIIAKVCREARVDRELSKRHYSAVLGIDPTDMDAIDNLIEMYVEDSETEKLVALIMVKADLVHGTAEKAKLLLWAGDLYAGSLSKDEEAISAFNGVLDLDPRDMEAIVALEALYEKNEMWMELVDVLGRKADFTESHEKVAALKKKGLVQHDRMENTVEAIETYLQVMAFSPGDVEGLRTLDRMYGAAEDWWNLYSTLESLHELVSGEERLTIHFRMGKLLEREIGDATRAVQVYEALLSEFPDNKDAVEALEGMVRADLAAEDAFRILAPTLSERQEWMRLYVVYEVITDREEDVARKVANLLTMGEIAEMRMEEPLRGFECFGKAFVADPLNRDARERIESLAASHDMWENVPGLMLEGALVIDGSPEALGLRLHAARILRDRLSDLKASAAAFEKIIEDIPDNHEALEALDELYSTLEDWKELARILRAEFDASREVADKVRFMLRFATVCEDRLNDSAAALDARQEVLFLVPNQSDAVAALRMMFNAGKHRAQVLDILEPIYVDTSAWEDLTTVYEAALADVSEASSRRGIMVKLAEVWEKKRHELRPAMTWYGKAFELDATDESLLIQIEMLAGQSADWKLLLDILLAAAKPCEDEERKIYLWHKALETARDKLSDLEKAEQIGKWVLEVSATDRTALAALDAMYESQQRWADLLGILNSEVAASEYDDEKIGFLMRVGALQRERLGNLDGAVAAYKQIAQADEMHRPALTALSELHDQRGEWEELFNVLSRLSDVAPESHVRSGLQRRMAVLAEEKLEQSETALGLWDEVSRADMSDVEALRNLQRLYAAKGDWAAYVDSCERELPLATDDQSRTGELLRGIAVAAEKELGDTFQAQNAWRRILDAAPGQMDALQALRRLYRESGDVDSLAKTLEAIYDTGTFQGAELKKLLEELAQLLTEELPRFEVAIKWWNKVVEIDGNDVAALKSLDRLYEEMGRFGECVGVIKRLVDLSSDNQEKAEMLSRAASMQSDQMKDLAAAAETLQTVVGIVGNSMDVSERLGDLYVRLENWDALAETMLARDEIIKDIDDRVNNLSEIARVYENRKGEKENAFLVYVKSADVAPTDENTFIELWRLARDLQNWGDYVDMVGSVVERMGDDLRLEHLVRFGEVLSKHTERKADAIGWYEKVLKDWPENESALVALTDLYAEAGNHGKLVDVLEKRVDLSADYIEKVELQFRAGQVLENEVHDPKRAVVAYAKILDFDDSHVPTLDALIRLYEQLKDWEKLVGALDRKAGTMPPDEIDIRFRAGTVLEEKVGDAKRAIKAFEAVLEQNPAHSAAIDRLQSLYGGLEDWAGLADVFQRLLDMSNEVPDRILYCNRLGVLYHDALGDDRKALDYYLQVLDLDPEDDEVFETAVGLLTKMEDWSELVNLYESRISRVEDVDVRIATLTREADVYEKKQEDVNSAITCFQRMLNYRPDYVPGFENLIRLFEQMEAWEDVVDTYLKWKEQVDSDHHMVDLMMKAVDIVRHKLENPDRAIEMLKGIMVVDPTNQVASKCLIDIYGELEDWEKVAGVHLGMEPYLKTDDEKARARAQAGDIYLNKLKDRSHAIEHFERALEINPKLSDVALALASTYVASARWEKAEPLLDLLVSDSAVMADAVRAADIHYNMGLCAEKLFDYERAFREYTMAVKTRPGHFRTVLGLGRYYQRKELWQLAKDNFMKAVINGREELTDDEKIEIGFALGEINLALNDEREAGIQLDKVLALAPNNEKAVDLQIAIAERRKDWPAVIRYKQARVDARGDAYERFSVMLEIGDIYKEKMQNVHGAMAAYKEALSIDPGAKVALMRLYNLHLESGAFEDALYMLNSMALAEENMEQRSRVYVQMAALYQEKLGDDVSAIEYLNLALDADPDRLEAFRAIDEVLTQKKDWDGQAKAYSRMLERLAGRGNIELEYRLHANLGEIYRSRLKNMDMAIFEYQRASQIKPSEKRTYEILAQLFEVTEDATDKAIDAHRQIVMLGPISKDAAGSYKAMQRLYMQRGDFDRAFVVSSIMTAMGIADEKEKKLYEDNLEPGVPWFKGTIDPLRWETHLMAKDENVLLGRTLQVLFQGVGSYLDVKELKDLGLRRKPDMDMDQKLMFVNIYKAVNKALGPLPHKVYRDDNPTGMKVDFLVPPALVVGADMMTGHDEYELAFQIGRQLTFLHPMHFLASVKNLTELKILMAAVFKYCKPEMELGTGADVVMELSRTIDRKMGQQQKNQMTKLVDDLMKKYPMSLDDMFRDFFRSIEVTQLHAGTLVACNVPSVMNFLRTEQSGFSNMTQRERIEEVLRFAISDDHYILRSALGINLESRA
ncbi:MAG TPA: tetratricopeptide repeat protein [Myxococcota bacterium]|nr:tetratricopeptide repeat protein [Myxococcota bacterium]